MIAYHGRWHSIVLIFGLAPLAVGALLGALGDTAVATYCHHEHQAHHNSTASHGNRLMRGGVSC